MHLLLEVIRQKEPPIERAVVASEEMMALLLGLLAREPTQRLRVEDLRRNQLFTRCAEMPPSSAMAQGQLARDEAKEELRSALPLAMVALRPQAMPMEPLRADANEDAPTRSPTETGGELTRSTAPGTLLSGRQARTSRCSQARARRHACLASFMTSQVQPSISVCWNLADASNRGPVSARLNSSPCTVIM